MLDATKALIALLTTSWAIDEDWFRKLYSIVYDRGSAEAFKALVANQGEPLEYTYKATQRHNIGIIPIQGPIFPKANLMTEFSGATSLELITRDMVALDKDPNIEHIVFPTNTPGGATTGLDEFWALARELDTPTYMHGTGLVASAGYWAGSGMTEMSASPITLLGSIGVMMSTQGKSKQAPDPKELTFVSSVSPRKLLDPETEEGAAECMEVVDGIAEVFVTNVAEGRGVSPEVVKQNFGKGGVLIASKALDAGMIDRICTFESLIARLSGQTEEFSSGDNPMNLTELESKHPEVYQAAVQKGSAAAKASLETEILTVSQASNTLKAENDTLKKGLETAEATVAQQAETIKDNEKDGLIRQAKAAKDDADGIMAVALAASKVPVKLQSKIAVPYTAHVDESGALNKEAYTEAVNAEVKDWSDKLGASAENPGTSVAGFGTGGDESISEDENKAAEAVADTMFDYIK